MKYSKLIFLELIMIFASVLIFRSTWTLLDRNSLMNSDNALWIMLMIGVGITVLGFYAINAKSKLF